jgi:hypothetical protein
MFTLGTLSAACRESAPRTEDLLEIIMRRYERYSTLLTSNRPVEDWGKRFRILRFSQTTIFVLKFIRWDNRLESAFGRIFVVHGAQNHQCFLHPLDQDH